MIARAEIGRLLTLTDVYNAMPADVRIVPGHGPVIGREEVKWHLDYLAEIKFQVENAIARGLSLLPVPFAVCGPH